MLSRLIYVVLLSLALSLTGSLAQAQPSPTPSPSLVEQGLNTPNFDRSLWIILASGIGAGAIGGALSVMIQRLNTPVDEDETLPPFWLERVGIGAGAGVIIIWFVKPESSLALLTFSVIAGSVGPSVFTALQDRVKRTLQLRQQALTAERALAEVEVERVKANVDLAQSKLTQIREEFRSMRDKEDRPSKEEWDQIWGTLREFEQIAPQRAELIASGLLELQTKLNDRPLTTEPQHVAVVDAAIDKVNAMISMSRSGSPV
ncbi:MAG: hypothetical protein HC921_17870 [Synechococcaceae cyanobacterium SM2_3_1]|nr:hypothetical protein [Synechococcaceae cyanobacterium SM2_3_1]